MSVLGSPTFAARMAASVFRVFSCQQRAWHAAWEAVQRGYKVVSFCIRPRKHTRRGASCAPVDKSLERRTWTVRGSALCGTRADVTIASMPPN